MADHFVCFDDGHQLRMIDLAHKHNKSFGYKENNIWVVSYELLRLLHEDKLNFTEVEIVRVSD